MRGSSSTPSKEEVMPYRHLSLKRVGATLTSLLVGGSVGVIGCQEAPGPVAPATPAVVSAVVVNAEPEASAVDFSDFMARLAPSLGDDAAQKLNDELGRYARASAAHDASQARASLLAARALLVSANVHPANLAIMGKAMDDADARLSTRQLTQR